MEVMTLKSQGLWTALLTEVPSRLWDSIPSAKP